MKSRARQILDKSIDAMMAAIEIYNKPSFGYREEAFSILVVNAWELLLKGRILQLDGNRISAIIEYENRQKVDGQISEKLYRKKNRSGNHCSIGLFKAHSKLINEYGDSIDPIVLKNLEVIAEIRDNAIHFLNKDFEIKKKVHEIGTASLKNYLYLVRQWFGADLSQYQLFLMPIAFLQNITSAKGININSAERNLLSYVESIESEVDDDITNDFNLSLDIDIKFKRVSEIGTTAVVLSNDPDAIKVSLSEEDIREKYPWDYKILTTRLKKRYSDFVVNSSFYSIKRSLEKQSKFCNPRYLDPGNPKSTKKNFYNPNILKEFDKQYKRIKKISPR
jgi:uncharacterized protein DUF3644